MFQLNKKYTLVTKYFIWMIFENLFYEKRFLKFLSQKVRKSAAEQKKQKVDCMPYHLLLHTLVEKRVLKFLSQKVRKLAAEQKKTTESWLYVLSSLATYPHDKEGSQISQSKRAEISGGTKKQKFDCMSYYILLYAPLKKRALKFLSQKLRKLAAEQKTESWLCVLSSLATCSLEKKGSQISQSKTAEISGRKHGVKSELCNIRNFDNL